jgi:hypothetical protein
LHKHKSLTGERFVRGQVDVAEWIEKVGRHRLEDVMVATAYTDIREPLARSAMELVLRVGNSFTVAGSSE